MAPNDTDKPRRSMELEGSLSAFSLPEILQFLSLGRMTGELSVHRGDYRLTVSIVAGRIVNARASSQEFQIGQILINHGLISAEALDRFLDTQRLIATDKRIGDLLVERRAVSREQLDASLRAQMEEEIWALFGARDGGFKFEHKLKENLEVSSIDLDSESLIMEGTRREDEWKVIQQAIPGEETVLMANLPLPPEESEAAEDDSGAICRPAPIHKIGLRPQEWSLLAMIDGFIPVSALCRRSPLGRFETYHTLYSLMDLGFLRVKGDFSSNQIVPPDAQGYELDTAPRQPSAPGAEAAASAASSGRLRSMFSRAPRPSQPAPESSEAAERLTPVSLLARYINDLVAAYARTPEFGAGEEERAFFTAQWLAALTRHREADLARATGFGLDATAFDQYADMAGGISPELGECLKVCLEAMQAYLKAIFALACQRLGERAARHAAQSLLETYQGVVPKYEASFSVRDAVNEALG